ncbi:isopenicillin N synthase family dioxygenase [Pseudonocardia halophobica]|uniref:isopenicillin N synthase family dioxygenase n=1 Tax=Pseudonocardia halophobica TaxID=29401 RepID=UPI003D8A29DF
MTDTASVIPAVDLADLRSAPHGRRACAETVHRGLRDIGFVFVRTPEVAERLRADYRTFAEVLDRPEAELERYRRPDIHHLRGYTPLGAETAAACRRSGRGGAPQPDHRSCWLIGPEGFTDPTLRSRFPAFHADNVWPEDAPGFRDRSLALHARLDAIGHEVLRALEPGLGYEEGFFDEVTRDAGSSLRPLRYPPVPAERLGSVVWGCRHTDGNLVSVLPPSTSTGLKVKVRGGGWIDAVAPPGHSIVQVGDMLQYMTGGHLRSAVHRIDAPDRPTTEARYSAPLFVYPRADVDLRPHERWGANPDRFPSRTAADYFLERLRRIGLDRTRAAGPAVGLSRSGGSAG